MQNIIKILNDNNIKYSIKGGKIYLVKEYLNLSNKKLTGTLDLSMIKNLSNLNCSDNKLTKIICNEKLEFLNCTDNKICKIVCNENLEHIYCGDNNLTKIICNEKLQELSCGRNKLTEIICNDNLRYLMCYENKLTKIKCNGKLSELYCFDNPILKLNRNNIKYASTDIYIYNNDYYRNKNKLEILNNKYFIRRFKYKNEILYVYRNYMINNSSFYRHHMITNTSLYNLLNEKYN